MCFPWSLSHSTPQPEPPPEAESETAAISRDQPSNSSCSSRWTTGEAGQRDTGGKESGGRWAEATMTPLLVAVSSGAAKYRRDPSRPSYLSRAATAPATAPTPGRLGDSPCPAALSRVRHAP